MENPQRRYQVVRRLRCDERAVLLVESLDGRAAP